jgi:hypothetical protein
MSNRIASQHRRPRREQVIPRANDANNDDFWDDSLLIRAYDDALAAHQRQNGTSQPFVTASADAAADGDLEPFRPVLGSSSASVASNTPVSSRRTAGKKRSLPTQTPQPQHQRRSSASSFFSPVAPMSGNLFSPNPALPSPYAAAYGGLPATPQQATNVLSSPLYFAASPQFTPGHAMQQPYFDYGLMQQQYDLQRMMIAQRQEMLARELSLQQAYYYQQQRQQQQQSLKDYGREQGDAVDDQYDVGDDNDDDDDVENDDFENENVDGRLNAAELMARLESADPEPPAELARIPDEKMRRLLESWYKSGFKSGYYHCAMGRSLD